MYRFKQAAYAIGITEAALRNWLTREKLGIWGERPEGGWRTFDETAIFKLAIVAELVSFGIKVMDAYQALELVLVEIPGMSVTDLPDFLYARRDDDFWTLHAKPKLPAIEGRARSLLVILPQRIINDARRRLHETETA